MVFQELLYLLMGVIPEFFSVGYLPNMVFPLMLQNLKYQNYRKKQFIFIQMKRSGQFFHQLNRLFCGLLPEIGLLFLWCLIVVSVNVKYAALCVPILIGNVISWKWVVKAVKIVWFLLEMYRYFFIDDYLSQCPYENEYAFMGRNGESMTHNAVKLFTYCLQKELHYQFSSHRLRQNFATNYCIDHVWKTGQTDVFDFSILMGHESVETTKKYYEHFVHEITAVENYIAHLEGVWEIEKFKGF